MITPDQNTNPEVETLRAQVARLRDEIDRVASDAIDLFIEYQTKHEQVPAYSKALACREVQEAVETILSDIPAPAVGWRKYPDQKPKGEGTYMTYEVKPYLGSHIFLSGWDGELWVDDEQNHVTHWMPLPAAPAPEKEGKD